MKLKNCIVLGLMSAMVPTLTQAQEKEDSKLVQISKVEIGIPFAGYSFEQPIIDQLTINANLKFLLGYAIGTDETDFQSRVGFGVEPRYYYSFNKRVRKGKNTKNNAANFFSFSAMYMPDFLMTTSYTNKAFVNDKASNRYSFSPKWNIRRNFGNSKFA